MDKSNELDTKMDNNDIDISIIPVGSNKVPFNEWSQYKTTVSPISKWHSHYTNGGYVGLICGKVSGNLECIDIDVKNDPNETIAKEYSKLIPKELLAKMVIQTTPNKGYHFIYKCTDTIIQGSQKLAYHSDGAVIIETRGEGGYFCSHITDYNIKKGVFDLKDINIEVPVINKDERDFLLETARSLTRYFPKPSTKFQYNKQAIIDFNENFDILKLFIENNWSITNEDEDKVYLLRNGSNANHSGYYFKDSKTFYCFSSSTLFKNEQPYNHFQILKVLEGIDDYSKTLNRLSELGYSSDNIDNDKTKKITSDQIAQYLIEQGVRYDSFIQDLTINGKIIDERENNTLFINIQKHFEKEIPRSYFENTMKSHYIQTVNPILNFVEKYKDRNPNGMFEQWISCIELKNPNISKDILVYFFKKWYVGLIAQTLDGEFPNEFFLALLSIDQGIGKTTMLRKYTIPAELQGYCKEHSLSFDEDFKVIMSQAILIVDDEMDGRTYAEDKEFKTVLSTNELTLRRKYDRRISTLKRRCSFAGSGNNINVIREHINRRIIPIEIKTIDQKRISELNLIDLYMEAYNLFKSGFKYSFVGTDMVKLKSIYEDYVLKSDLDEIIDNNIDQPANEKDMQLLSNIDIILKLTEKYPTMTKRISASAIGKIMNDRGYECIRQGKNKTTCYKISRNSGILGLNDINPDTENNFRLLGNKRTDFSNLNK